MTRRLRRQRSGRGERGATALEVGLVLPVLALLVFGLIQYGFYFWSLQTGAATAREAARRIMVGTDLVCVEQEVQDRLGTGAAAGSATRTMTVTYESGTPKVGELVTVTVTFDALVIGFPLVPVPGGGRVVESASARVENIPLTPLDCG